MIFTTHPPSNKLSNEASPIEGNEGNENSPNVLINKLREKCGDNITIAHLNINFLQNKFQPLASLVQGKVDILTVSETKIDDSFTTN